MNEFVLFFISIIVVLVLNAFRAKRYDFSAFQFLYISISEIVLGLICTQVLFLIENGVWGGYSFFGAVLFLPISMIPISMLTKRNLFQLLDYVTPPGLALLVLFKINCYLSGCCGGKVMYFTSEGIPVYFPSQIAEMTCAAIVTGFLLFFETKSKFSKLIYPVCITIYGVVRFILNFYRWDQIPFAFGLTAGHFWSLVSVFIGVTFIVLISLKKKNQRIENKSDLMQ